MVRTKVFVGNLSFKMRDVGLSKEFEKAGKVLSANIISRGPRSLGYGFVEFESEQEAQNAVKMMDKVELGTPPRPINVEIARPREEEGGEKRPRRRREPTRRSHGKDDEEGNDEDRPRNRRPRGRGRVMPRRRDDSERTLSKSTLFIASLPFHLEEESLGHLFKEAGVAPKSVSIPMSSFRKGNRGFGFVEFESESDQKKAMELVNQKEVDGRKLQVKVAFTPEEREAPEKTEERKETKPVEKKETKPVEKKETKPVEKKETKPVEKKETKPVEKKETKPVDSKPAVKETKPAEPKPAKESKPVEKKEQKKDEKAKK